LFVIVMKVQLHYRIGQDGTGDRLIRNPLLDLLHAIREQGSISGAARALALSYRHVWGELKRWESALGDELLVWEKGQAARLSEFGEKLLWAERQAQARLSPQIEALRADLERAFAMAFDAGAHVLSLHASHDDALAALREFASADKAAPLHLDVRFCGSVEALRALNEGRCGMAGFHTQQAAPRGTLAARTYKPLLKPGQHKLIGFARRTQGLMVAPSNPLKLRTLADLARSGARFVNRPAGTGTRVLLDGWLDAAGMAPQTIDGYQREEPSHSAVAQSIRSGSADAGLGIEHTASRFGLGFVPLAEEDYVLVCHKAMLEQPPVRALRALLSAPEWQQRLALMPGYAPHRCGEVLALRKLLPWWSYAQARRPAP
jgi:putative molybdopterin biosynthesis protein